MKKICLVPPEITHWVRHHNCDINERQEQLMEEEQIKAKCKSNKTDSTKVKLNK